MDSNEKVSAFWRSDFLHIYLIPSNLDPDENKAEIMFNIDIQNKKDDTIKLNILKINIYCEPVSNREISFDVIIE